MHDLTFLRFLPDYFERSIHVHVWHRESFDNFLTWTIEKLNLRFEILETHLPEDVEEEMIYVIEKIAR